jgi:hypothetical protein
MANVDLEKGVPDVESSTMPKIKKKNNIGNPGMRNFATTFMFPRRKYKIYAPCGLTLITEQSLHMFDEFLTILFLH